MKSDPPGRRSVLLLLFASGAAALAHQVVWTRRLVDILGANAETFSKVVGAFCIGLALGSAWAAIRPATMASGWRRIAVAELAVALLGGMVLGAMPMADALRQWPGTDVWLRWLLPVVLVTPPAMAMGIVLPALLTTVPGRSMAVRAYAINTLGGVAGIILTVFLTLPGLGLVGAGLSACGVNLLIAGTACSWHRRQRGLDSVAIPEAESRVGSDGIAGAGLLAFASGFLVLGLEVVAQHQFAQVTINSHFSSAAVLAAVLLALGGASLAVARRRGTGTLVVRNALLLSTGLWLLQPAVFLALRPGLQIIPYELTPERYLIRVAVLTAMALGPGFLAAGFLFPLLLRSAGEARTVARWLALNGLGGWLGAELTQAVILPSLGLWRSVLAAAAAYLVLGIGLSLPPPRNPAGSRVRRWLGWGIPLVLTAAWVCVWPSSGRWPQVSPVPGERVVEVTAGREGVVATVVRDTNDWRIVFNNTYTLGGSRAQANQERQAHLPLLLHGRAQSVALLGVATGSTLAGAALHPGITRLDAFELSPLAARFARDYFAPFNRGVFHDPRVRVTIEDARWAIARQPGRYDVVIGDLFLPWRTGEGRLFTHEHFAAVHRSLHPNGLFCQWLPLFQLTRAQYDGIVRTFLAEFPGAFLLRGDFYPKLPIVGLCAFADGRRLAAVDWSEVAAACERLRDPSLGVQDPLVRHEEGVAMCVVGELPASAPGPVNTLGNGWLEWEAARNIIGLRSPWFIGVPAAEYLRDRTRQHPNPLPAPLRPAQDSGQFFLTLEVAREVNAAVLPNLRAQMRDRLPASLRHDTAADWSRWPGSLKPFVDE